MERRLVIVGGSPAYKKSLVPIFQGKYNLEWVGKGREGLDRLKDRRSSVVLLDAMLPDMSGLEFLDRITRDGIPNKTILFYYRENMALTIHATKLGAFDCIPASLDRGALERKVQQAFHVLKLAEKIKPVPPTDHTEFDENEIIGGTHAMREIYKFIGRISNTNAVVGIRGETGTGKELVARVIHSNSANRDQPFITVDCSTLVETLSESTLYGHEKGSFTGAHKTHPGQFEIAGDGTIFLDEIADIPLSLQSKLLRFLQEKEYQPVGSNQPKKSNARIIAATNRDLYRAISDGRFRKDLYYRLKVLTIFIPPLRERREDIPLLIRHFLHKINRRHKTGVLRIEDRAVQALMEYEWPGNVRELENLLTQACLLGRDEVILEDVVKSILNKSRRWETDRAPVPTLAEVEKNAVRKAILFTHGNLSEAARLLNISRPTLRSKIRKYDLERQPVFGKKIST